MDLNELIEGIDLQNKFEDRIVKFNRIAEDVTTPTSAEVRQLECEHNSNIPRSVTARFVKPLNAVMTLGYDTGTKTFRGPLGPDILESDFDITDFIKNAKGDSNDRYVKSPKRNRP